MSTRFRDRTSTLLHGIDVDAVGAHRVDRRSVREELQVTDSSVLVGIVANFRTQKNYPLMLQVAADIQTRRSDIVFVSVGQGPLEGELRRLHADLGLGTSFRFLGFRSDVHRLMAGFDALCLSSDFEGLPVSVMEAKALGLPVISTAVGGIPEAVHDGIDGLVVPARDADALAAAIERVADEPTLRLALGAASQAGVAVYEAEHAVRRQEQDYAAAVGAP